jgi:hypothetical protein
LHRCVRFHDTEYAVYGDLGEGAAADDDVGDDGGVDEVIDSTWREATRP